MSKDIAGDIATFWLNIGLKPQTVSIILEALDEFEKEMREQLAKEILEACNCIIEDCSCSYNANLVRGKIGKK